MGKTSPLPNERWGLLGGAFDPIHLGHVNLALEIFLKVPLDGVIFIPSVKHPLKDKTSASFEDRVRMIEIATEEFPEFEVSEIEQELSGFTIDTIKQLKAERDDDTTYYFIVGTDNVEQINHWKQPERIIKEVSLVAGGRPGYDLPDDFKFKNDITLYDINELKVSSTHIRKFLQSGNDAKLHSLLNLDVLDFIRENNLYHE